MRPHVGGLEIGKSWTSTSYYAYARALVTRHWLNQSQPVLTLTEHPLTPTCQERKQVFLFMISPINNPKNSHTHAQVGLHFVFCVSKRRTKGYHEESERVLTGDVGW